MQLPADLQKLLHVAERHEEKRALVDELFQALNNGKTTVKQEVERVDTQIASLHKSMDLISIMVKHNHKPELCDRSLDRLGHLLDMLKFKQQMLDAYITGDYSILQQD